MMIIHEKIERAAMDYVEKNTFDDIDGAIHDAYISGAKSERNKTIDEAIDNISQNQHEYISKENTIRLLNILKV